METKTCTKCKEDKPATLEYFHKVGEGLAPACKACRNKKNKQWRETTREQRNEYAKQWRKANPGKVIKTRKRYYEAHPERVKEQVMRWQKANLEKVREQSRDRVKRYRENNPSARIAHNLRRRVRDVLNGATKSASTMELIGCTIDKLMQYLEAQFTDGMTWNNYGKWHVDHIVPCSAFDLTDPEQQRICFNYTNLQPLWEEDNHSKNAKLPHEWQKD